MMTALGQLYSLHTAATKDDGRFRATIQPPYRSLLKITEAARSLLKVACRRVCRSFCPKPRTFRSDLLCEGRVAALSARHPQDNYAEARQLVFSKLYGGCAHPTKDGMPQVMPELNLHVKY